MRDKIKLTFLDEFLWKPEWPQIYPKVFPRISEKNELPQMFLNFMTEEDATDLL